MRKTIVVLGFLVLFCFQVFGQDLSNYLITTDIGDFIASKNPSSGKGPGIMVGADHFYIDHTDTTYRISYFNAQTKVGPKVQITQHTGTDSDKWLLHEVDADFRNYYGIPGMAYTSRQINGQTVFVAAVGGREYRWLNGKKVVVVKYRGSLTLQPEPLDIVNAYLAKHPSTLPAMSLTQMRSADSKTQWIKDEMDRRLWLCDKWFYQLQLGKVQQGEVFEQAVKSMNIFLDYREKYYGVKAADEKNLLAGYLNANNGTLIKAKLDEYKKWWAVNKEKGISL